MNFHSSKRQYTFGNLRASSPYTNFPYSCIPLAAPAVLHLSVFGSFTSKLSSTCISLALPAILHQSVFGSFTSKLSHISELYMCFYVAAMECGGYNPFCSDIRSMCSRYLCLPNRMPSARRAASSPNIVLLRQTHSSSPTSMPLVAA